MCARSSLHGRRIPARIDVRPFFALIAACLSTAALAAQEPLAVTWQAPQPLRGLYEKFLKPSAEIATADRRAVAVRAWIRDVRKRVPEIAASEGYFSPTLDIRFDDNKVLLDGKDVTAAIRTPEISQQASRRAADPSVRAALVHKQRALLDHGDWVAEGRDIGTVVAPDADLKVWLTADEAERARRRGVAVDEVRERDQRDAGREHSPMVAAGDAVEVDTTGLSVDQVVQRIVALVNGRHAA